jgi:hypothetical protein
LAQGKIKRKMGFQPSLEPPLLLRLPFIPTPFLFLFLSFFFFLFSPLPFAYFIS